MNTKPTHANARMRPAALAGATWTSGFWADRFDLCRSTMIDSMRKALEHPDNAARVSNFRVAARDEPGEHCGS